MLDPKDFDTTVRPQDDFSWAQWTSVDFTLAADKAIEQSQSILKQILELPSDSRTFSNTVFALQMAGAALTTLLCKLELLLNVHPDQTSRDAAKREVERLKEASLELEFNEELYQALIEYTKIDEPLDGPDKKLLEDMLRSYKRKGFGQSADVRQTVKDNFKKLEILGLEFDKNLNECKDFVTVSVSEAEGLPDSYLENLGKDEQGNYIVTLKYPDYFPFIENAKNTEKRREIIDKFFKRGGDRNIAILREMLIIRANNARLLGYNTYADYVLEEKMAKTPTTVSGFLSDLTNKLRRLVKSDLSDLLEAKKTDLNDPNTEIKYFDTAYYSNQLLKQKYNLNKELVREYFPLEKVVKGTFDIYSTLLSVKFIKMDKPVTWDDNVELYRIDNLNDTTAAYFFLDLHPREGKYGHAAVFPVLTAHKKTYESAEYQTPLAVMVANFTKPGKDRPSLLTHEEVETFFHEFGHVMHHSLSKTLNFDQAGFSTARDFVEAPSQMLEHWVWAKQSLKLFSEHYRTAEALPDELINTMFASKHHMDGMYYIRQLLLATFDFRLHTEDHAEHIVEFYNSLVDDMIGVGLPPDHRWPANFAHIAGHGYAVGYYGYLWSKVYGDDMFSRFEKEGLLNPKTGMDYRNKILAVGSSREEMESLKDFLGREPNNQAFLRELGIAENISSN